jgi:predicted nucleic-acid-binding Zn-ribbon protein
MTDEQFCKIETALTGEPIDKIEQLVSTTMTGRELKEYLEAAFALYNVSHCEKCNDVHDLKVICEDCIKCECNEYM